MEGLDLSALMGPLSGLAISLFFSFQFLQRFEKTTERLLGAFEEELDGCNQRYAYILNELMKLKEKGLP